jgi:thiosulfate dehydrogenase
MWLQARLAAFVAVAGACGLAAAPLAARAADPAQSAVSPLQQAVQHGADLFVHESFGGSGNCQTCHLDGGRGPGKLPNGTAIPSLVGAAAGFPRYSARSHEIVTLSQQLSKCIAGALHGTPPASASPAMVDLETYVTSLSKGAVMGQQFN